MEFFKSKAKSTPPPPISSVESPSPFSPPELVNPSIVCEEANCKNFNTFSCSYVDRKNNKCVSNWCPEHSVEIKGKKYCRRHSGIMQPLSEELLELTPTPDLDSRAASLVEWTANFFSDDIETFLTNFKGDNPELHLAQTALSLTQYGSPRKRGWLRTWQLASELGPYFKVSMLVEEDDDTILLVKVNGEEVAKVVPPWIHTSDISDEKREEFKASIIKLLQEKANSFNPNFLA